MIYVISISESTVSSNELTITASHHADHEAATSYIVTARQIDAAFGDSHWYETRDLEAADLPAYADELRRIYGYCGNDWSTFKAQRCRLPKHRPIQSI